MKRRSILLALGAVVASSMSSGCYCYRPLLWRFGGCGGSPYGSAHDSGGSLLGAPMGSPAPVQGGYAPVGHGGGDPGCVGCGGGIGQVGGGGYPIAHGGPMTGGYPGMPAANGGYAGMPTTPGGYTAMPAGMVGANPPFTGYPSLLGPNGQPALGQPVASRPLPAPSVLPGGAK